MKQLSKKVYMAVLALLAGICFMSFAMTASVVKADQTVPVYRVTIERQYLGDARTMTNRIPISKDAQKVTFEYTPIVSTGTGNYNALMAFSGENQNTGAVVSSAFGIGYGVPNGTNWVNELARVGRVYTIEVDMVNLTAEWYYTIVGETEKHYIRQGAELSNPNLTVNYIGFSFASTNIDEDGNGKISDTELAKAWYAELDVRCFDDKGRDLQVCSMQGGMWVDGITEKPNGYATLASFDEENDYFLNNNAYGVGEMAHNRTILNVVDAAEIGGSGAKGGVLEIKKPPQPASFSIQMGRVLTAEDIAKGGSVVIRVWSQHNNSYLYGCNLAPFDTDQRGFDGSVLSKAYFQEIMNIGNQNSFKDLEIPNEDLLKFCDKDGNFKGFSFWMGAWEAANYTVYIDEIFYKLPVNVNLYDQNGTLLGSKQVNSGYSLNDQFSVIVPDVEGKEFVGWTKTLGGIDYYNVNEIGYESETINLYASYATPVSNVNDYIGVYANQENGKFFQLDLDGKVIDETGAVGFSTYQLSQTVVLFDEDNVASLDGFTITVNGDEYVKQENAYTVEYRVLEKTYKSIVVPEGYNTIQFEYQTEDFIFGGWKNGDQIFDFTTTVAGDLVLDADLVVNEIATEEYAIYQNTYYSSQTGIIYIVKSADENGVCNLIKIENGTATTVGEYKITKSHKLLVGKELYEFRPMKTSSSSQGEMYVGPLEIFIDGYDYWIFNKTFTVTVHYDEERKETFEVGVEENFLFGAPETPSKDGYTFNGWRLGNGQEYKFDQAVTSELEIYAIMEYNNVIEGSATDGCFASISSGNVITLICSLAFVAVVILKQRKTNRDGNAK